MNRFLFGVAQAVTETFDLPEPIVEIGSYQVEGQEAVRLRSLFPGRDYTGIDMRAGPGVDCVANVENLPQETGSVGTVIAMSTFEHVRQFWRGFDEVQRVLRPDGIFLVACPFFFRIHNYPHDYWRFTPAAFESLLESYPSKIIGWHGARQRPSNVWSVALGPDRPPITQEQFVRHRLLVQKYAYEPAGSLSRPWLYRFAGLFCGRGPFASYLDRNRWDAVCLNADPEQPKVTRLRVRVREHITDSPLPRPLNSAK
jgi:SAM-dependent methyltransferase